MSAMRRGGRFVQEMKKYNRAGETGPGCLRRTLAVLARYLRAAIVRLRLKPRLGLIIDTIKSTNR